MPSIAETTAAWAGDGAPRMEIARVRMYGSTLTASGTQLGAVYELRYELEPRSLHLEVAGDRRLDLDLEDADFFDLGFSPLFNSLPVIRDELLTPGPPRDYTMCWVDVPTLEIQTSQQRYEPIGDGLVRFSAGTFTADISFDRQGLVVDYPGIARRV